MSRKPLVWAKKTYGTGFAIGRVYVDGYNISPKVLRKLLDKMDSNFCLEGKVFRGARCKVWLGTINMYGYGSLDIHDERVVYRFLVHRISLILDSGEIPNGLETDHLCRNRACFEAKHLEAVTKVINQNRVVWTPERRAALSERNKKPWPLARRLTHSEQTKLSNGKPWSPARRAQRSKLSKEFWTPERRLALAQRNRERFA